MSPVAGFFSSLPFENHSRIESGVNWFPRFSAPCANIISILMNAASLFFLLRHIGDLKYLSAGQWLSIIGSGITAFGISLAADPHHCEVAIGAAIGTLVVAIVHVMQPSPVKDVKVESSK